MRRMRLCSDSGSGTYCKVRYCCRAVWLMSSATLGAEERPSLVKIRVQRLDAEPVPRAEQYPLLRVPDEEREHSPKLTNDLLAQVVVTRDDRFAVAVRLEGRTEVAGQ